MQLSSVLGAVDHGVTGTAMVGAVSAAHLLARARHPADQYSVRPPAVAVRAVLGRAFPHRAGWWSPRLTIQDSTDPSFELCSIVDEHSNPRSAAGRKSRALLSLARIAGTEHGR